MGCTKEREGKGNGRDREMHATAALGFPALCSARDPRFRLLRLAFSARRTDDCRIDDDDECPIAVEEKQVPWRRATCARGRLDFYGSPRMLRAGPPRPFKRQTRDGDAVSEACIMG